MPNHNCAGAKIACQCWLGAFQKYSEVDLCHVLPIELTEQDQVVDVYAAYPTNEIGLAASKVESYMHGSEQVEIRLRKRLRSCSLSALLSIVILLGQYQVFAGEEAYAPTRVELS